MKIGIIITCFNNASAINACIESVANIKKLTAEKLNLELIAVVIDDCSTDASFQMLGRFFEEDKINIINLDKHPLLQHIDYQINLDEQLSSKIEICITNNKLYIADNNNKKFLIYNLHLLNI